MLVSKGRLARFPLGSFLIVARFPYDCVILCVSSRVTSCRSVQNVQKVFKKGFFLFRKCAPVPVPFLRNMFGCVGFVGSFIISQWS